ncbi:MAG: 2-phosphoglycerate kinase [Clostridiales bacterium]|nr:2-phosphoglycerate kinase [Clostridiales bacterium]
MIIIISAASCSGKTLMSQTLLEKYKIPYYSIDHIKMGIFRADENCGFTPCDSNEKIGLALWPMLKGIIKTSIENSQNLIIEGCYILPEFLKEFEEEYAEKIISIFFGFSKQYVQTKFETGILKHRCVVEKRGYDEERPVHNFIEEHQYFKLKCQLYDQPYFEINTDYEEEIQQIYDYIDSRYRK